VESEKDYAILNTLYVVGEYFGWVEVLRREVQFLDLGDLETNRHLSNLLVNITKAFGTNDLETTFRLFNGEQRAIGEIMLVPRSSDGSTGYECMGYATFVEKMSAPEFARWFSKLRKDIEKLANESDASKERLILIHDRLIDLVDFLDSNCSRIAAEYRTRIKRR
jgi:hypothetical protein